MKIRTWMTALLLLAAVSVVMAQSVDGSFQQAIRSQYNRIGLMRYYTIVPYGNQYFGSSVSDSWDSAPNETKHFAIWEYVNGRWSYIFSCTVLTDADEEHDALDRLFQRYRFSPAMRQKLMYGTQRPLHG